jgi:hypothetical protein
MSIFRPVEVPCPACNVPVTFQLVHSVNADRRPDLRQAIIDRTFQKETCPSCGFAFRTEPEFTYLNLQRGQWIAVWPASKLADWSAIEQRSREAFDKAFGAAASPAARDLGKDLRPRAVFGWAALSEKLVAQEAGIDDVTLELAKLAVVRSLDDAPLMEDVELRLLGVEDGAKLVLGWIKSGTEDLKEVLAVPKDILAEVQSQAEQWKELRVELTAGLFVDIQKLMIPATPE